MITALLSDAVVDVLNEKFAKMEVFSAYDITKDVRRKVEPEEKVFHSDVRQIINDRFIHNLFPDDYHRECIELNIEDTPRAIVYYPDGKSFQDHPLAVKCDEDMEDGTETTPTPSVPAVQNDVFVCEVTREGRLNIPKKIIPDNCDTHVISFNGRSISLKTNSDGRLRVSIKYLDYGDKFEVWYDVSKNGIEVKKI